MADDIDAQDEALVRAVFDDREEVPLEAVPVEDDETSTDAGVAPAGTEASGVTSHVLVCNGTIATSKSTFRAPTTGWLYMRVGYFDASGARLWLSPWVNKGSMNALTTKTHVEAWDFKPRRVARAIVVSRFPSWDDQDGSRWANC
jgi:hypothetical protein